MMTFLSSHFFAKNLIPIFPQYANYLRAATKVRGLVGSKRTYSFLGYNCTSFAADVANEAGIAIKAEDSGDKMKTFRQKNAWIDSPYSLAKYVRSAVPQDGDEAARAAVHKFESLSFQEQMDKSATTAISKGAMKRFLHNLVKARSCVPQSLEGDYNTLGTKFVKAVTRNQNRYAHKKRITRNEMVAKRRETLQKQAQAK